MQRKWVTMGDVARHAGVGKITVSRALREPAKVSPETLARVRAAVDALGYVLDETAGALSSQRSRIVGALVSTLEQPVFASTIRGLTEGLREGGLHLMLATTQYAPETEAELVPAMLGRRPEALVLTNSDHAEPVRRQLATSGIPSVELWDLPETPICAAVGFSNREAARDITRYLVESGRREIAFLHVDRPGDTRARMRREGYGDVVAGLHAPRIVALPVDAEMTGPMQGARGLSMIRECWPGTDAVVCVSDALALGAWCEAMRAGIAVPDSLAITGFGDFDYAGAAGIGLTTIRIDGAAIGRTAAALIREAAGGTDISGRRIDMGYTLMRRATG